MAVAEQRHWWFTARRTFLARLIGKLDLGTDTRLLEAGCGSGGNLTVLAQFGTVFAFEPDAVSREFATARGIGAIAAGRLPDAIPFEETRFHVIGMFDVLEHLEQPVEALRALAARLTNDGAIVITVPAYPWLWSEHDRQHHHVRRYTRAMLEEQVRAAGLHTELSTHANSVLLPVAIGQRVLHRVLRRSARGLAMSSGAEHGLLNAVLLRCWLLERAWFGRVSIPFGLSIFAILRRSPVERRRPA